MRRILKHVKYTSIIVVIIALLRILVFEVYLVPSKSMTGTILPGELILINKLPYGARLCINEKSGMETRAPGFSKIKHNDIIVFNFPEDDTLYKNRPDLNFYEYLERQGRKKAINDTSELGALIYQPVAQRQPYIKRCIGLPGDTLRILRSIVFVNNQFVRGDSAYWAHIRDSVKHNPLAFLINNYVSPKKDAKSYHYHFPHHTDEEWYNRSYGPLYIPKKGASVKLTLQNLSLYIRIITAYEHNKLDTLNGNIHINGETTTTYTFKQNYYFMMGDNYWGSTDSRFWGFVPENHIIGKAVSVIFSTEIDDVENKKIRWNRIFKNLK
jgi:signal peptidase I